MDLQHSYLHLLPKVFEHQLCTGEVGVRSNFFGLIASAAFNMQFHPKYSEKFNG